MAVFHHCGVLENSPLALIGAFRLLNGPFSDLNGPFPRVPEWAVFLSNSPSIKGPHQEALDSGSLLATSEELVTRTNDNMFHAAHARP